MSYGKDDLKKAIVHAKLSSEQAESLQIYLESISNDATYKLTLPALLWYFGTALVVLAVVVFSEPLLKWYPLHGLAVISILALMALAGLLWLAREDKRLLLLRSILWLGILSLACLATIGLQFPGQLNHDLDVRLEKNPYIVCLVAAGMALLGLSRSQFLPLIIPFVLAILAACRQIAFEAGLPDNRGHELMLYLGFLALIAVWPTDLVSRRNLGFWLHKVAVVVLGIEVGRLLGATSGERAIGAGLCIVISAWSVFLRRQSGIFAAMVGLFFYIQYLTTCYLHAEAQAGVVGVLGVAIVLCGNFVNARQWHLLDRIRPRERVDPVIFDASPEALHVHPD